MNEEKLCAPASGEPVFGSSMELLRSACSPEWRGARLMMFTNQPLLAHGVRCLLSDELSAAIVLASGAPAALPEAVETQQPDILLVDLTPEVSLKILTQVCDARPAVRIIVLAGTLSLEMIHQLKMIGVRSILKRDCTLPDLVTAFSQGSAEGHRAEEIADDAEAGEVVRLSRREGQLVTLLSHGLKNKEIAQCLGISEGTVRVYLSKLYLKIGVNDRFELALFGLRNTASVTTIWPKAPEAHVPGHVPSMESLWLHRSRERVVAGMAVADR